MTHYVYIQSEPNLWTVGFYNPAGEFQPESDHADALTAAARVNYLNGGGVHLRAPETKRLIQEQLELALAALGGAR
jgi:hypothetical protein